MKGGWDIALLASNHPIYGCKGHFPTRINTWIMRIKYQAISNNSKNTLVTQKCLGNDPPKHACSTSFEHKFSSLRWKMTEIWQFWVFPKLTKIGHFWHVAHPREQKFWQNRVQQIQISQNERLEEYWKVFSLWCSFMNKKFIFVHVRYVREHFEQQHLI